MKKVDIWSFKMCPFCVKAKKLLDKLEIAYEETVIPWGDSRLQELEAKTGCGSLPQIFADGEFIGDCSKIHDLHAEGVLEKLLKG
jgi:glutaredoxin 3